ISLHMWPFHLNNSMRKTGITAKACLRLVKTIGSELPGLFLLAMADSLAGQGVDKPENMEISLAELYGRVDAVCRKSVLPVLQSPPLLTGTDLVDLFDLQPGPIFGTILSGIEKARVENEIRSRDEAIEWVGIYLEKSEGE
ncbi:MAG: polynucleotide adenylyltransferase, partial [Desulfobulbaceae bacterium]|nr:polynucleotide adenylyltransferase [Desulfobulbaceae bacterium]